MNTKLKLYWHHVLPKYFLTRLAGILAGSHIKPLKNFLIQDFLKRYPVNMQEALDSNPYNYASFNDFFTRKLKPDARPIAVTNYIIPADGCISQAGHIEDGSILQAKGKDYSVAELIADADLAKTLQEGAFATIYLAPKDYHRIHMPIDGRLISQTHIPGSLFSVQAFTAEHIPNLFARNERLVLHFETAKGPMVLVLVGATIVGSIGVSWLGDLKRCKQIETTYFNDIHLQKGDELGYFKLGSTVIMLLNHQPDWQISLKPGTITQWGQALAN